MKYLLLIFFLVPFFSYSQSLADLEPYMEKYSGKWGHETDEYKLIIDMQYDAQLPLEKWISGFEGSTEALLLEVYYLDKIQNKVLIAESALKRNYDGFVAIPKETHKSANFRLMISEESYISELEFKNTNEIIMVTKEQKGTKILLGNGKDKRLIPLPIQNEIHLKRID